MLIDILDCGVRPLNFVIFSSLSVASAFDLGLSLLLSDPCLSLRCGLFTCIGHTERVVNVAGAEPKPEVVAARWCFGGCCIETKFPSLPSRTNPLKFGQRSTNFFR